VLVIPLLVVVSSSVLPALCASPWVLVVVTKLQLTAMRMVVVAWNTPISVFRSTRTSMNPTTITRNRQIIAGTRTMIPDRAPEPDVPDPETPPTATTDRWTHVPPWWPQCRKVGVLFLGDIGESYDRDLLRPNLKFEIIYIGLIRNLFRFIHLY